MVKVPEYQQSVSTRPIFQEGVTVQASPEAFGAGVGRGMQGLAQGVSNLGGSLAAVKELEDINRAKEADNSYASWARERMYGQNGFMTLEGRNAVDGRSAFENEAEEKRKEFGKGLTPGAAKAYQTASQARTQSMFQQSITHTAQQQKTWFKDASTARIETFANDALVNFGNPTMVNKNVAAGIMELREQGQMAGWDTDTLKQREAEYVSGVHKNITLRMAQDDPIAADKYISDHSNQLSGADRYSLQNSLKTEITQAKSKRAAADFFASTAKSNDPGVNSAVSMISRFEGFATKPYWDVNHFRVGFGSDTITGADGRVVTVKPGMTVSRDDAVRDLNRRVASSQSAIISTVGQDRWNVLSASAKAAVTSVGYNYGTLPSSVANAIKVGGPAEIATAIRELEDHNGGVNAKRRNQEANAVAGFGTPSGGGNDFAASARSAQNHFTDMESYLANIKDPDVQDMTRKRINAMIEAQGKADEAREKAAKADLWKYIDQGQTPDQVPMEVRQAAGMSAVSSAWNYLETSAKGRAVDSNETLLYDMRKYSATNPSEFANVDLNDYRDRLSKEAIKELTEKQSTALTDQRKAREDGLNLTSAFSQAQTQLEAVGVAKTPSKMNDDDRKRVAQFQNALAGEMEAFKRANDNRAPTQVDIQSMVNKLLLPVVIKTPGTFWDSNKDGLLFEAGSRADGTTVDVDVKYSDIPIDLRRGIAIDLERDLGRKPSQEEVTARYEDFVLNR
ncbi:hypothetical protein HB779_17355 [Phyllobacterium sp. 628]|uniref:hypothetical protein n=1 Tax=Phyllobacterium sp. 628 TaxID=2718938 RepID=UPI001662248A|nr:hypothetical protein [Phyllobacterium sp. 628]QND53458.1 hypothetical protein HB779_17355 [Phyllobacterium sp. 628]